jgi:hypothetical protein
VAESKKHRACVEGRQVIVMRKGRKFAHRSKPRMLAGATRARARAPRASSLEGARSYSVTSYQARPGFSFSFTPWLRGLALKPQGPAQCAAVIGPNTVESALRTLSGSKVYASAAFVAACAPREAANSLYIYSRPPLPISNPFCDIRVSHHNQQNPQLLPFPSSTPSSPSPPQQRTDHSALFNTFIDPGELRDQDSVGLECLCAFAIAIRFAFSFVAKESSEVPQ